MYNAEHFIVVGNPQGNYHAVAAETGHARGSSGCQAVTYQRGLGHHLVRSLRALGVHAALSCWHQLPFQVLTRPAVLGRLLCQPGTACPLAWQLQLQLQLAAVCWELLLLLAVLQDLQQHPAQHAEALQRSCAALCSGPWAMQLPVWAMQPPVLVSWPGCPDSARAASSQGWYYLQGHSAEA